MSPSLGSYGDTYAVTPHLDRFAAEGVRYLNAFATIGVCAPARSTIITGMYPPSIGTHHMRCQGRLPKGLRCFTEYLREAGYYTTNNVKTDYNFKPPPGAWDESSTTAHWRGRNPGQPFFSVFNLTTTHESQVRLPKETHRRQTSGFSERERHDPALAPIPPYHPDVPEVRRDWARYADRVTLMDQEAGRILGELEADGLAADTIVFFFSDHGAGLPRSKRWLYDSSLRVPFIVRFPEMYRAWAPGAPGACTDRLLSFVDLAPTMLSLAGIASPPHMQGFAFLGARSAPPRQYVFGFRDRMDERYDLVRAVRDRRYKLIRNFLPQLPYSQHVSYMFEMPAMQVWARLHREGRLRGPERAFFGAKPVEELYDTWADPHEVHNLALDPDHRDVLERLRAELRRWIVDIADLGFLPEAEMRGRFGGAPEYDAVRADPRGYPLERVLAAAETASRMRPESLPDLVKLLDDPDAAVRFWGAVGLSALGPHAAPASERLDAALRDPSPSVRVAAAEAVAGLGRHEAVLPMLRESVECTDEWVRLRAAIVLDDLDERARPAIDALRARRQDPNEYVVRVVAKALADLGEAAARRRL
jgi:arylsulfatase A-like enzyme